MAGLLGKIKKAGKLAADVSGAVPPAAAAVLGVSVADVEAAMAQAQQPPRPQGLLGVQ